MSLRKISTFLSFVLRHKPESIGIKLDGNGWAKVNELIAGVQKKHPEMNMELLERIVAEDDKMRYSFSADKTLIRANQGHSVQVDVELDELEPPILYHGTGEKYVESIDRMGLISKSRLYVHLSSDTETAYKVGIRHGTPVIYTVDAPKMYKDGYKFYRSANGVWLTDRVPPEYLKR